MRHRSSNGRASPLLWLVAGLATVLALQPAPGDARPRTPPGVSDLLSRKQAILEAIEESPFEQPIHVESEEAEDAARGHVYAVVDEPFGHLVNRLKTPSDWCEIMFLHLNVKACVHAAAGLTIYTGRKHYQRPEDAERIDLGFRIDALEDDSLAIELGAERGPYGTQDFDLQLRAVPLDRDRSLLHLRYSAGYGSVARLAMGVYFAFGGRDRIGFTVERLDEEGKPVYVRGVRGMVERNAVRFYLALQACLEVLETERLEARLARWFDLTERHPEQLRELDKATYLENKRRERDNQEELQRGSAQRSSSD